MGKYVHKFNTVSEKELAYHGSDYLEPWLSYTVETSAMGYNKTEEDLLIEKPLTFEIIGDGNIIWKSSADTITKTIEYSKNSGEWTSITSTTEGVTIPVVNGDIVMFSGNNETIGTGNAYCSFSGTTATFNIEGNIMSLLDSDNFAIMDSLGYQYALKYLFSNCTGLKDASKLLLPAINLTLYCYAYMFFNCTQLTKMPKLPATYLNSYCYNGMFSGCTSLTTAEDLPATGLEQSCCKAMFQNCTNLIKAPKLPATYLNSYCYSGMFKGCTSLKTCPELPATTLGEYCYEEMFEGCTSLTVAPELPATNLRRYCYSNMFKDCVNLETAPELLALTLVTYCYYNMFRGCTKLNYVKAMFTTQITSMTTFTSGWLYQVSASGTFVKNASATWTLTGGGGIPEGWTVETASE